MSWYACALIMLESTTPFGNFRYLMSKSDSPLTGKSSALYAVNAVAWLVSPSLSFVTVQCEVLISCADVNLLRWRVVVVVVQVVFFLARVCSIPVLLSYGFRDATNLFRSVTVTRSDRLLFLGLLGSYLSMCPLNVYWFSKMVRGALKLLKGQDPEADGTLKQN
jgi:hypothetical protein